METPVFGIVFPFPFIPCAEPPTLESNPEPNGAGEASLPPDFVLVGVPGSSSASIDARRMTFSTSPDPLPQRSKLDRFEGVLPKVSTSISPRWVILTPLCAFPGSKTPSYETGRYASRTKSAPDSSPSGLEPLTSASSTSSPSNKFDIRPKNPSSSAGSCITCRDAAGLRGRVHHSRRSSVLTFEYNESDLITSDEAKSNASIRTSNKPNESTSSPSPVPSVVSRVLIPIPPAG
mmetsp:Transcript_5805/g.26137  ORF Transcript_5805/g.26137 Transcript_5805/m.26137 type:complete len:234 (-) Transcript_5805:668-1369(-)